MKPPVELSHWVWMAPFQNSLYYGHANLYEYLVKLEKWLPFDANDEAVYDQYISAGLGNGWLRQIPGDYALIQVQPAWSNSLKQWALKNMPSEFWITCHTAFTTYYNEIARDIRALQISNEPDNQQTATAIMQAEWANMQWSMLYLAAQNQDYAFLSTVLRSYFQGSGSLERWLEQALLLLDATGTEEVRQKEKITRLDDVATTLLELKRPAEARKYIEKAWEIAQDLPVNDTDVALIRSALCNSFSRCADTFGEQRRWLEAALNIAREAGLESLAARMAYNLSELLLEHRLFHESQVLLEEAVAWFRKTGSATLLTQGLLSLAGQAQRQGDKRTARRYLREALRQRNSRIKEAEIRQDLASVYFEEGKLQEAKRQLKMALPVFITTDNRHYEGNSLNLLSAISFQEGAFAEGLEYAQRAMTCFSETAQWGLLGQTLGNIALFCYEQNWWEDCVRYALQAKKVYEEGENEIEAARQGLMLGAGYSSMGNPAAAKEVCASSRSIFERLGDKTGLLNVTALEKAIEKMITTDLK